MWVNFRPNLSSNLQVTSHIISNCPGDTNCPKVRLNCTQFCEIVLVFDFWLNCTEWNKVFDIKSKLIIAFCFGLYFSGFFQQTFDSHKLLQKQRCTNTNGKQSSTQARTQALHIEQLRLFLLNGCHGVCENRNNKLVL